MNPREAIRNTITYITAADAFRKYIEAEDQIKLENTGRTDVLPFDAGLEGAARIYLLRLKSWPVISGKLIVRWSGIDLAIKGSRRIKDLI